MSRELEQNSSLEILFNVKYQGQVGRMMTSGRQVQTDGPGMESNPLEGSVANGNMQAAGEVGGCKVPQSVYLGCGRSDFDALGDWQTGKLLPVECDEGFGRRI